MPLTLTVPGQELYDSDLNYFYYIKPQIITLEHSLKSIAKWEAKWGIPYLTEKEKTTDQVIDYVRCMTLTQHVDPSVYMALTSEHYERIMEYMKSPMTATTINNKDKKKSREIVTAELIYYWMTVLNIPFDPCQNWHINRLMTLIEVCSIKSQPPKKMSRNEILRRNSALNAQRRAKHHTKG